MCSVKYLLFLSCGNWSNILGSVGVSLTCLLKPSTNPADYIFCLVTRGLYYHLPAHSCKEILELGVSKLDGEYWIDPEKNGKALKVYCDMTTNGGKVWNGLAFPWVA